MLSQRKVKLLSKRRHNSARSCARAQAKLIFPRRAQKVAGKGFAYYVAQRARPYLSPPHLLPCDNFSVFTVRETSYRFALPPGARKNEKRKKKKKKTWVRITRTERERREDEKEIRVGKRIRDRRILAEFVDNENHARIRRCA